MITEITHVGIVIELTKEERDLLINNHDDYMELKRHLRYGFEATDSPEEEWEEAPYRIYIEVRASDLREVRSIQEGVRASVQMALDKIRQKK